MVSQGLLHGIGRLFYCGIVWLQNCLQTCYTSRSCVYTFLCSEGKRIISISVFRQCVPENLCVQHGWSKYTKRHLRRMMLEQRTERERWVANKSATTTNARDQFTLMDRLPCGMKLLSVSAGISILTMPKLSLPPRFQICTAGSIS